MMSCLLWVLSCDSFLFSKKIVAYNMSLGVVTLLSSRNCALVLQRLYSLLLS